MIAQHLVSCTLLVAGAFFFFSGTVGLLRFPDIYTRLHAVTKADNLGLGLVVAAMIVEAPSVRTAAKLGITWALVLASSSLSAQLIAKRAFDRGTNPWSAT
jgi:multicomponent Na+:H+ antiporter subunit G